MKKVLFLLVGILFFLSSCAYELTSTVEAWNWTFNPIRDVEVSVDGDAKIVSGWAPYMRSWEITWEVPFMGSDDHDLEVGVREIGGTWVWVTGMINTTDTNYVTVYDTYFTYPKSISLGNNLNMTISTEPPDIKELIKLKEK